MPQKIELTNEHYNVNLSENIENIHSILTYLSDNCDYAHQNDGVGFNAIDTWIGHNLSILNIEFWDDTVIATAAQILLKYKKQIKCNNSLNYEAVVAIYKSTKDVENIHPLRLSKN